MSSDDGEDAGKLGKVHVLTGPGRGKSTSAFGLASRAWGRGLRVTFIQFMKREGGTGEAKTAEQLGERFEFVSHGCGFVRGEPRAEDVEAAAAAMKFAKTRAESGDIDMLVLDEACVALDLKLVTGNDLEDVLGACGDKGVELVLTGRGAPDWLLERADYATELGMLKHPYSEGLKARRGVEF